MPLFKPKGKLNRIENKWIAIVFHAKYLTTSKMVSGIKTIAISVQMWSTIVPIRANRKARWDKDDNQRRDRLSISFCSFRNLSFSSSVRSRGLPGFSSPPSRTYSGPTRALGFLQNFPRPAMPCFSKVLRISGVEAAREMSSQKPAPAFLNCLHVSMLLSLGTTAWFLARSSVG